MAHLHSSSPTARLVRGVESGIAHHAEMMILPPDWTYEYTSIFRYHDPPSTSPEPTPEKP